MSNVLDPVPTWVIMLASLVLLFGTSEIGYRLGVKRGLETTGRDPSVVVQASAFTLLALLMGFSFSLALGRYDARRGTLLREVNSIATTYFRASMLDPRSAGEMQSYLRSYVGARLAFARADNSPVERASASDASDRLQNQMWTMATQVARRDDRSTTLPLFIASLNDTINLSVEERAVLSNHIPDIVIFWLLLISLVAAGMMGFAFGRFGHHAVVVKIVFAAMVALVFGLVLDLDRPQRGIIRVNLAPLAGLQQKMNAR